MPSDAQMGERVVARMHAAINAHDIDAFVACFAADYDSMPPAHPHRAFRGAQQVRANWSAVFAGVPDFRAELVAIAGHYRVFEQIPDDLEGRSVQCWLEGEKLLIARL